jgi:hypothetical protein
MTPQPSNPCPVFLMGPSGYIEEQNLGTGNYTSPITGNVYPGVGIVCSQAEAEAQVSRLTPITGLKLAAIRPKGGQYGFVAAFGQPGLVFGYPETGPTIGPQNQGIDPASLVGIYVLVNTDAVASGDLVHATIAGNVAQLITQEQVAPGHWIYEPMALFPAMGNQLQYVRD